MLDLRDHFLLDGLDLRLDQRLLLQDLTQLITLLYHLLQLGQPNDLVVGVVIVDEVVHGGDESGLGALGIDADAGLVHGL